MPINRLSQGEVSRSNHRITEAPPT